MGVLLVVLVVLVLVVVTGGKQSQLIVPRQKSGLWTYDWSLTKVSFMAYQGCYKSVSRVVQRIFKQVSWAFQGHFIGVSRVNGVLNIFQGRVKDDILVV